MGMRFFRVGVCVPALFFFVTRGRQSSSGDNCLIAKDKDRTRERERGQREQRSGLAIKSASTSSSDARVCARTYVDVCKRKSENKEKDFVSRARRPPLNVVPICTLSPGNENIKDGFGPLRADRTEPDAGRPADERLSPTGGPIAKPVRRFGKALNLKRSFCIILTCERRSVQRTERTNCTTSKKT